MQGMYNLGWPVLLTCDLGHWMSHLLVYMLHWSRARRICTCIQDGSHHLGMVTTYQAHQNSEDAVCYWQHPRQSKYQPWTMQQNSTNAITVVEWNFQITMRAPFPCEETSGTTHLLFLKFRFQYPGARSKRKNKKLIESYTWTKITPIVILIMLFINLSDIFFHIKWIKRVLYWLILSSIIRCIIKINTQGDLCRTFPSHSPVNDIFYVLWLYLVCEGGTSTRPDNTYNCPVSHPVIQQMYALGFGTGRQLNPSHLAS